MNATGVKITIWNSKQLPILFLFALVTNLGIAQQKTTIVKTPTAVLQDFMDQRFGMFIHWGPVNLRGTEIG